MVEYSSVYVGAWHNSNAIISTPSAVVGRKKKHLMKLSDNSSSFKFIL